MVRADSFWPILFALGAYHGINPAMGWLFAVALGLQNGSRKAVLRALPPIALGHFLSVGAIAAVVLGLREALPLRPLKLVAALVLIGFGLYRLVRARHPGWVGMRVGFKDLTIWSFIMATACGAGLMLVPLLLRAPTAHRQAPAAGGHSAHLPSAALESVADGLAAVFVHTLGHLLAAGAVALLVYDLLGVAVLRKAWINLDLIWVGALIAAGLIVLFV